ncbi:MAG: hypothetical protein PSV13_06470 [Lacunisphaera sp.]|nr:hypothetical protein [Lacunisphaera sp.]
MNTKAFLHTIQRSLLVLAGASLLGLPGALSAADKEPVYNNYIDFAVGTNLQKGDRPGFQKAMQKNKSGAIGIEDLFYTNQLNDDTVLTLRGHAMAEDSDYLIDLNITKDEVGYVKLGYKGFRTWYDGSGGVWPTNGLRIQLYDEDLHLDRGNLWFEAGFTKPDAVNFTLRYDLQTKKGKKDSTSWMDTGLAVSTSATRYIVPTYLTFDEKRHILDANLTKAGDKSEWALGARLDKGDYTNGRYSRRTPGQPTTDRYVTAKEGQDYDLTQFRGSYLTQMTEQIKLTTAVSRTKIDTILSGSRTFGIGYDAEYTNNYPTRQQRDEGYFGLHTGDELGESEMTQTVATINALYTPTETFRITPGFRFEKTEWHNKIDFEETNFGAANTGFAPINDEVEADSEKDWKTYAGSVDARYTGIKNFALNFKADMSSSEGMLMEERILEPGTPLQAISIDRDTKLERNTQKYAATANWYVRPGTSIAVQYYIKARQNDYRNVRDNTVSTADRYPAYIANQDLETNDFNVRLTWRATPTLRTVTRYDYQKTTINTQDIDLAMGESMNSTQHIISETVNWTPTAKWSLQGNINYVNETLKTPAAGLTGAAANLVKNSDANYVNFGVSSSYAIDDQSDLMVDYMLYKALGNYVDNSAVTVPYGTDSKLQMVSLGWSRRLDRRTTVNFKYTYAKNEDVPSLGTSDYEAHLFYAKLQYRF